MAMYGRFLAECRGLRTIRTSDSLEVSPHMPVRERASRHVNGESRKKLVSGTSLHYAINAHSQGVYFSLGLEDRDFVNMICPVDIQAE